MSIDSPGLRRIRERLAERGLAWLVLNRLRRTTAWLHTRVEAAQAAIERRHFLSGPDTLVSSGNTLEENREKWNSHDWSKGGEEWTEDARERRGLDPVEWKARLIADLMDPHLKSGARVLEIGPGAGRWTELLLQRAGELHLADISSRCLELCRERFGEPPNLHFHYIEKPELVGIADQSIDFVWSYDVFVHINPNDTAAYLRSFARVLAPGARAVIHHPGSYADREERSGYFRSDVDASLFEHMAVERGLRVVSCDAVHAHLPGDRVTILEQPA